MSLAPVTMVEAMFGGEAARATVARALEEEGGFPPVSRTLVTPTLASQWLRMPGRGARPVNARVAQRYAAEMRAGRWLATNNPIVFDRRGELFDGSHRLAAVVESGVSLEMTIVFAATDDAFVVDR